MRPEEAAGATSGFRLAVPLHSLLAKPSAPPLGLYPQGEPQVFPDPVFPQRAELLGPVDFDAPMRKRKWTPPREFFRGTSCSFVLLARSACC